MTEALPVGSPEPVPDPTACRDGCGAAVSWPERNGWTYLEITKRWRCPACRKQTEACKAEQEKSNDS